MEVPTGAAPVLPAQLAGVRSFYTMAPRTTNGPKLQARPASDP